MEKGTGDNDHFPWFVDEVVVCHSRRTNLCYDWPKCKWVAKSLVETDLSSVVTSNMTLTELNSFLSLAQGLCPCIPPLFPHRAGDETSTIAYFLIRVAPTLEHNYTVSVCYVMMLCIIGR